MVTMPRARAFRVESGATMIEVLVTIFILAFGLLGLAGLQARLQVSEMEAYQRAQALVLLNDMASRIATNRANAINYVTGTANPLGTGMACPAGTASRQDADSREWCLALQGTAVTANESGANVGAMLGGRGCVESLDAENREYRVTVAWQGLTAISAPPNDIACGLNAYDGGACTNDRCRRVVTTTVRIAQLD